jgi:tetratricopeptide (TPR) repeat protein
MNSELLARLMVADPAERQWLLLESVLESLSEEVRQAVWAIAVPHWFDDRILAALCPEFATQSTEIYQELQALSFVEVFEGRGHNIHEATRSVLLDRLWHDRSDEFKLISARAAEYFADDAENVAEWLYHKAIGGTIGNAILRVMEPLDHNFRRSEWEVILKALHEQVTTHRVESEVIAEVAYAQGKLHQRFHESDEALENYRLAIEIFRGVGNRQRKADSLRAIADVLQFKKQTDEALENYRLAIEIYRQVGYRLGEANILKAIADVLQFKRQTDEALENYRLAIEIYRQVGARLGEANTLQAIANVLEVQDERDEALKNYRLAIEIYRQLGSRLGEANCLQGFGHLEGNIEKKLQFLHDAQQIYVEIGSLYSQSRNLSLIACAQESQGNSQAALASWTTSRDLAIEINYEPFQTSAQEAIDRLSTKEPD